jgi:hypothetical protein
VALYIVVRHPENPDRSYSNVWTLDNRLLLSITAPKDVAMSLTAEREMNARVFVHRCAWGDAPARVWCSVLVGKLDPLDRLEYLVTFVDPRPMDREPPFPAHHGQNSYTAPAP